MLTHGELDSCRKPHEISVCGQREINRFLDMLLEQRDLGNVCLYIHDAAMCLAAILVAATGVSREMQELKDYKAAQESLRETCDSVYCDIDITIEKMVSDYLGRIKGVPYYDFVIKEYMALHDDLKKYKESWLAVSADPAILSAFEQHFVTIYNSHVHKIMVDPLLPLLDYAPIPPDEMAFYKSLLDNNEPYRQYVK